jgi:dimethylamine/trimethylamine dehydrogenase
MDNEENVMSGSESAGMGRGRYDILFEPVRIGPKVLKNRFVYTPHFTGFGTSRSKSQAAFRELRAEGGWAAVWTESCSISQESDGRPRNLMTLWDDDDARAVKEVVDGIHRHDSLAGVELTFAGAYANSSSSRIPTRSPSPLPTPRDPLWFPRAMDRADIKYVQKLYVDGARRARDIGFDLVSVYGGFTYLPLQFLSPFHNKRTDEYGGSLENRARFWLETLEQIREAIGEDCAVSTRLAVESFHSDGIGSDEALEFIRMADHLVDFWDPTLGGVNHLWKEVAPSRFYEENHMAPWLTPVREYTNKPIVNNGRFINADTMVSVIEKGQCDLIGATRPGIADPFLPRKIQEGRIDELFDCIGCNMCRSRAIFDLQIACTQNATAGEEFRRGWHPERFSRAANADKPVLIIGGGAAGLECGRVLGKRGMQLVHIVDRSEHFGGYARRVGTLPGLGQVGHVVDAREYQISKLDNVELIPGMDLDVEAVLDYGAEIVICATGSSWSREGLNHVTHGPIPGADLPHVLTPEDVMESPNLTGRVLIYDTEGYFMGAAMAELLALRGGCSVSLMAPFPDVAPYLDRTNEGTETRERLISLGVELLTHHRLLEIQPGACAVRQRYGKSTTLPADTVILVTSRIPNDALYQELKSDPERLAAAGITGLYVIGDCAAPRVLSEAIFDGHRLAREIDCPDPATPLPELREGFVVGQ